MEEILENNRTTAVLGLAGDAQLPVVLTSSLVDVAVAVITDDVTLIKGDKKERLEGSLTCGHC